MVRHWPVFLALVLALTTLGHAASDAANVDAALNARYEALLARLDPSGQQRLREAQRAWLSFRDKECAFRARTGTANAARSACETELAQQRIENLDREPVEGASATVGGMNVGEVVPCSRSVDRSIADTLVRQCMQVSPATHPPCNADNACDLIRDEIKRGCAMLDKEDAPAFCAGFKT
jgi:Lysozyme inhibitor LprI